MIPKQAASPNEVFLDRPHFFSFAPTLLLNIPVLLLRDVNNGCYSVSLAWRGNMSCRSSGREVAGEDEDEDEAPDIWRPKAVNH